MSLATQCDMRLLAEEGRYGFIQVQRGVISDGCSHWLLPRMVGMERAFELLVMGRRLSGHEAYEWGLGSRLLPAAQVLPAALELAEEMATATAPLAAGVAKALLWQGAGPMTLAAMEDAETRLLQSLMGGADALEGGRAYAEKRLPQWRSSVLRDWPAWPSSP